MKIKHLLALGLAACLFLASLGLVSSQQQIEQYNLPGDRVFPEGIAFQPSTGDYFVSNSTDGSILRGNIARPDAAVFVPTGTEGLTGSRGMKVDNGGRLFVSGGPQGQIFIFNIADGKLVDKFSTTISPTFVNDVTITPNGNAYFTDSNSPYVYRVAPGTGGKFNFEQWLNVSPTISYTQGFNLGGIAHSTDGRYLVLAQGNVGKLYRVEVASKNIQEINLGGVDVRNTDGILIDGSNLYVMRNSDKTLVALAMNADFTRGEAFFNEAVPTLAFPTTFAKSGNRLLVVNGQFDKRMGTPTLPFTVSSIPAPVRAGQGGNPGAPASGIGGQATTSNEGLNLWWLGLFLSVTLLAATSSLRFIKRRR